MKYIHLVMFTVTVCIGAVQAAQRRSNPIVSHLFTADASAYVWEDGRLYIYPSSDTSSPIGEKLRGILL